MSFTATRIALILTSILFAHEAGAQAVAPAAPTAQPVVASAPVKVPDGLTLKERLGAKWKDEQRVDNCKVPPEKRGTKPRPVSCVHAPLN
jgi:hypothetical protein